MAKNTKSRQKKAERKAAKRKQKRQKISRLREAFATPSLHKARDWPLQELLITENWRDTAVLVQILVARRGPGDQYAVGLFLVDLACLGVKTALGRIVDGYEFADIRANIHSHQTMIPSDPNLIAKIVREGIAYARSFGIQPDKDYLQAMIVLGDADPDACLEDIPLGRENGKPYFVPGPYDNVDRIMQKLTKAVGPEGFDFLIPIELDEDFDFYIDDD